MKRFPVQLLLTSACFLFFACSPAHRLTDSNPVHASRAVGSETKSKIVGRVVGITDGDTITVLDENNVSYKIRLKGIDSPEKHQAFCEVSRRNLAYLIAEKTVTVEWQKVDQYGRIIGKILLDERDVCLEQVKAGFAWHFKKYEREQDATDRNLYAQAEAQARVEKRGLWQDSSPTPPWDYRDSKDPNNDAPSRTITGNTPSSLISGQAKPSPIWGNKRSMIYHWPGCPSYDQVSPQNRVAFSSREEAEKAGYRATRDCQ